MRAQTKSMSVNFSGTLTMIGNAGHRMLGTRTTLYKKGSTVALGVEPLIEYDR